MGTIGNDFLDYRRPTSKNIITNPPYSLAQKFIERSKSFSNIDKIAMLLRTAFLEITRAI